MYASVDEMLGSREGRFFGEGFKRVGHRLTDVEAVIPEPAGDRDGDRDRDRDGEGAGAGAGARAGRRPADLGSVRATAAVSYPAGWSRKAAGVSPRPHVSSIDAALFGVQLSELLVLRRFGLDAARHARMWPCALTVRAGAAPQEVLDGFPVGARLTQVRPVPGRPLTAVSRVDCVIGNAKVRCEVEHDAPGTSGTGSPGRTWYAEADQVLGPASARYYGMGYQDRSHYVEQVALDGSGRKASAVLTVRPGTDEKRWTAGIGGHYQPALSVLDIMIAFAQLNQVLMYHQDGVRRGQTHTLWLRKLVLTADRPDRPISAPMPLSAETAGSELVDHAGGRWRTFTMTGSMPGFTGHSMVAHRLPTP